MADNTIPYRNLYPTPTELEVAKLYQDESLAPVPRIPKYAADEVKFINNRMPRHVIVQFVDERIACSCGSDVWGWA